MDNPRLIDANALMARFFRKERLVQGAASAAYRDAQKTVVAAPTVSLWPEWRDPDKDHPKVETEVLVLYRRNDYLGITTAHYEDAMFSPRTANGIGRISLIGEHTTKNGMTTESRKDGGNTATSTRTMFTAAR